VHCEQCGEFSLDAGFFGYGWSKVPAAQKEAVAASLREAQGKYGVGYHLTADNWRRLARQGQKSPAH
jgi:hypothetical protein